LLEWFSDNPIYGLANAAGFALSIVSCGHHYPDSPNKIALKLGLPAERVLTAVKRMVLQTELTA
jgi:hypothetical protein